MASACLTERGDCLTALGRLDAAASACEEGNRSAEALNDRRSVAAGKGQLGTVRMLQKRYAEAVEAFTSARETFAALGEPRSVATAWHQLGMVHEVGGQYEAAEHAYQSSLRINVQEGDRVRVE